MFDSHYDAYKGVIAYVRIVDGEVKQGEPLLVMSTNISTEAQELGVFVPNLTPWPTILPELR